MLSTTTALVETGVYCVYINYNKSRLEARMPFPNNLNRLTREMEIREMEIAVFKALNTLYEADQDAAKSMLKHACGALGVTVESIGRSKPTNYDLIREAFSKRANDWATLEQLVEWTDIPRDSIRTVLYKSAADAFEKKPTGKGRQRVWHMKPEFIGENGTNESDNGHGTETESDTLIQGGV